MSRASSVAPETLVANDQIRYWIEGVVQVVLALASLISIITTVSIVVILLWQTIEFFQIVSFQQFFGDRIQRDRLQVEFHAVPVAKAGVAPANPDHLVVGFHGRPGHRPDDCVQTRTVAPGRKYADLHRTLARSLFAEICTLWTLTKSIDAPVNKLITPLR